MKAKDPSRVRFGELKSPSKKGRPSMNSNKWRTITIPKEVLNDLVASHLYAMRGMDRREIVDLDFLELFDKVVPVKIKMKEVNRKQASRPEATSSVKQDNAPLA